MPLVSQSSLDNYEVKIPHDPARDRSLALMVAPDETITNKKHHDEMEKLVRKIKNDPKKRRKSRDAGRRRSPGNSPRMTPGNSPHTSPRRQSNPDIQFKKHGTHVIPLKHNPRKHEEKPEHPSFGLISDDSWNSRLMKNAKVAPYTVNSAKTPYDIHDVHHADDKKINADGTYYDPEIAKVGLGLVVKDKPGFKKGGSTGYWGVSGATQERQEREACIQIMIACLGMLLLFAGITYPVYLTFKDMEIGLNSEFLAFCGIFGSILSCMVHYHRKGYNIFELFGGRRGGAVG